MLLELLEAPFVNIRIVSGGLRVLRVTSEVAEWFLDVNGGILVGVGGGIGVCCPPYFWFGSFFLGCLVGFFCWVGNL